MLAKYSVSRDEFVRGCFSGGFTKVQKINGKKRKKRKKVKKKKEGENEKKVES